MYKLIFCLALSFSFTASYAQLPLDVLKSQLPKKAPNSYDSTRPYFLLMSEKGVHYLMPLYQYILNNKRMENTLGKESFKDQATQWISFIDYQTSNDIATNTSDTLSSHSKKSIELLLNSNKGAKHEDAKEHIVKRASDYQIIMINEAHHNPSHRAFTFSLLEDLYRKGYRYFAMETFSNFDSAALKKVTISTGTYTMEPLGGELVRQAIDIGYKLIAYEDTAYHANHTLTQRDSAQAHHLYQVLQKDSAAKIVVHAGFGHIGKAMFGDYIPLGKALHDLSGKPYLSINQTSYSEGTWGLFGREIYHAYLNEYPVQKPVISLTPNTGFFDTTSYDLYVIHPKTKYSDGRPHWVSLDGARQKHVVERKLLPANTFLVQAYYEAEMLIDKIENLVPADQTYYKTAQGSYVLYLRKGNYILVLRDAYYNILKRIEIQIP